MSESIQQTLMRLLMEGRIVEAVARLYSLLLGNMFYTVLILFTLFMTYVKTKSGIATAIVAMVVASVASALIVPEASFIITIVCVMGLAGLFYMIIRR